MASTQSIKFSEIQKFKNGALSGCFVSMHDSPVMCTIQDIIAPLGVCTFSEKQNIILNVEDHHDVEDLLTVQAGAKEHPELKGLEFNHIIKCTEKYGRQMKVNITPDTMFFDSHANPCSSNIFKQRCKVNILVEINMIWIRGKQCGISVKCLQMKHIEDVKSTKIPTKECLI